MKPFFRFMLIAYLTALVFELLAHVIDPLNKTFDNLLIGIPFFLLWYGVIYTIAYYLLRNHPIWITVVVFAVFGTLAEIIIFKRLNAIVDPIIYAVMAFVPISTLKLFDK